MKYFGPWAARLNPGFPRMARDVFHAIGLVAALIAAVVAMRIVWIGPATIGIEIAYFSTRRRVPLWSKALSAFLLPFAAAMPAVVALQYLQNHDFFSASQTVAIESGCRDAGSFLKDVADLSLLRASGLLLVAVLLELLAPRWKVVSGYVRTTKALAFASGVLAAFSCFTFTTASEFEGDIKALRTTLQARLGSEKEEHMNVKVQERELSAQQEAIHQNLDLLLKLRAASTAVHARVDNATPNLEADVLKDTEYGTTVMVNVAKAELTELLSGKLEGIVFASIPPDAEHPKPADLAASTAAIIDGLANAPAAGTSGRPPRMDLIDDVEVLQKAVAREGAALDAEKKTEAQIRQAVDEESGTVFDTMIEPLKDRLKALIETLSQVDNGVLRRAVGDLAGDYLDQFLDKAKDRLSRRMTGALKSALSPVDELAARAYVSDAVREAHGQYDSDLRAELQKTGAEYDDWTKRAVSDETMDADLRALRLAFLRDALTEPAADDSIFDRAQVLSPLEGQLAGIEHDWAPRFSSARATIDADRLSAGEDDRKIKDLQDRAEEAAQHPEGHPI